TSLIHLVLEEDDLEGEVTSSSLTWPLPQAATLRLA
ncbi:hypothetical protein Tco_0420127, partial [Tanacetum coccineum]